MQYSFTEQPNRFMILCFYEQEGKGNFGFLIQDFK